jgi:hypothetical protein
VGELALKAFARYQKDAQLLQLDDHVVDLPLAMCRRCARPANKRRSPRIHEPPSTHSPSPATRTGKLVRPHDMIRTPKSLIQGDDALTPSKIGTTFREHCESQTAPTRLRSSIVPSDPSRLLTGRHFRGNGVTELAGGAPCTLGLVLGAASAAHAGVPQPVVAETTGMPKLAAVVSGWRRSNSLIRFVWCKYCEISNRGSWPEGQLARAFAGNSPARRQRISF